MKAVNTSFADPPFACPADVVIDLPPPPSVNRLRRIDFAAHRIAKSWCEACTAHILQAKRRPGNPLKFQRIPRYELIITVAENRTKNDLDNGLKILIDYLHRIEITENDGQKNLRRITAQWGEAPDGVRITVRPTA